MSEAINEIMSNNISKRGFGSMTPEKISEIASLGGKAAHAKGTAHKYTSEEAQKAGKLGGAKVSQDKSHMARIGKIGGMKSAIARAKSTK